MTRFNSTMRTSNSWLPLLLMLGVTASADTLTGTVVGVADGDTITVLDANREQRKIRLAGIDAPEKAQPKKVGSLIALMVSIGASAGARFTGVL